MLPVEMWHQWELGQRVACKGVVTLGVGSACGM